jgi:N,N'-diacetyllegionaminate synthase
MRDHVKARPLKRRTYIIAEAGVNHNGNRGTAMDLVAAAVEAGADAVKFQSFTAQQLLRKDAPLANYQKGKGMAASQFEMIRRLELDEEDHRLLLRHCADRHIDFISSPFSLQQVDMLGQLGVNVVKIPSGEIDNLPYLRRIGRLNRKVFLSTGMAEMGEIDAALHILTTSGTDRERITVLHCHTEYPTRMEDVNLQAMITIRREFNVAVGFSDHTMGTAVPVAAVALGAEVLEKHFTLDRNMTGPDHKASLEPAGFREMTTAIRDIEKALGDGIKQPTTTEMRNRPVVRKSIVAAVDIKAGESFTEENLTTKRPATGRSPMEWDRLIGQPAGRDYQRDEDI